MVESERRMRVLITGASGGIGRELALAFAREGHDLVVVARDGRALRELATEIERNEGVRVEVVELDLLGPDAARTLHRAATDGGRPVDVLVNNAGIGQYGPFLETDPGRSADTLRLNAEVPTDLTARFLPEMVARGRGGVLNVASTAAFQPGPLMSVYYATKAYVLHLSEALDEELRGTGVRVTTLCPGPTETRFQERAGMSRDLGLFSLGTMDARSVAEAGVRGFLRGRRIVVPGATNRILAFLSRFAPRGLATRIVRRLQERREGGSGRPPAASERG